MPDLTDAEVICGFCESRPPVPDYYLHLLPSPDEWWVLGPVNGGGMKWYPCELDLDALYEVEQKLKQSGRHHSSKVADHPFMLYTCLMMKAVGIREFEYCDKRWGYHGNPHDFFPLLHATAAQKTEALATVIRGIK